MNLNKKYVIVGLIIYALVWGGNILYYQSYILEEPLFMKHYIDVRDGDEGIDLIYLQNKDDQYSIYSIKFPEFNEDDIGFYENEGNNTHQYYRLMKGRINLNRGEDRKIPEIYRNKEVTKAQVFLSNGKTMDVDIGRIIMAKERVGERMLGMSSSSSSSNHTGSTTYGIEEDMKVTDISCSFPEILEEVLQVKVNEIPLEEIQFPIILKPGENLKVSYHFDFSENPSRRNDVYDFTLDILVEDREGKKGYGVCYVNYWQQFPEQYDVGLIRKERERQ